MPGPMKMPIVVVSVLLCDQIWQNLQSLGQFFEGLFTNWENLGLTLANFVCHWASFH